jgi:hypothetical protein
MAKTLGRVDERTEGFKDALDEHIRKDEEREGRNEKRFGRLERKDRQLETDITGRHSAVTLDGNRTERWKQAAAIVAAVTTLLGIAITAAYAKGKADGPSPTPNAEHPK